MIEITDKRNCCGCTACYNICPTKSISMRTDEKGFLYPEVDQEKCVDCKLCDRICPILNVPNVSRTTRVFSAQNKNINVRINSTSGGFFSLIAEKFINNDKYVCAAGYNCNGEVEHILTNKYEDLANLRGSKYVQSNIKNCYKDVKELLKKGKKVLFIGTPCQVAGLKNFLGGKVDGVLFIDLVCYGVPSPKVYKLWIESLHKKYHKRIKRVEFRDKTFGFSAPNVKIIFEDDSFADQNNSVKTYMKLFMNNYTIRDSCADCKFKGVERCSDITIGDCWSIGRFNKDMDDNIGTTNVFIHSAQGLNMFEELKGELNYIEVNLEEAVGFDGKKMMDSAVLNPRREEFFEYLNKKGYDSAFIKFARYTIKERMVTFIKRIFRKSILLKALLKQLR